MGYPQGRRRDPYFRSVGPPCTHWKEHCSPSGQAHCPCGQSLLRCPRCSQLHHQAFGQGQGTQVRACTWPQVIQRIQEVDHTITSVYLLTRVGICRYQASSVSVKRGGAVWKKIYTSFHSSLTQHMRVIGRQNPLAI